MLHKKPGSVCTEKRIAQCKILIDAALSRKRLTTAGTPLHTVSGNSATQKNINKKIYDFPFRSLMLREDWTKLGFKEGEIKEYYGRKGLPVPN